MAGQLTRFDTDLRRIDSAGSRGFTTTADAMRRAGGAGVDLDKSLGGVGVRMTDVSTRGASFSTQVGTGLDDATGRAHAYGRAWESVDRQTHGTFGRIREGIGSLGRLGLGFAAGDLIADGFRRAVVAIKDTVLAGSALNEQLSKSQFVFGDASGQVVDFADEQAKRFGLLKTNTIDAASSVGLIAKASGLSQTEAAKLGTQFAMLGADAASFFNVDSKDALERLRSGLVGETEPMRQFGVLLDEASVKQEGWRLGLAKTGDELTQQQKVQARASLIITGMADATGDLERTQSSLANRLRAISGHVGNFAADLGTKAQPAILGLLDSLYRLGQGGVDVAIGAFARLAPFLRGIVDVGGDVVSIMGDLVAAGAPVAAVLVGLVGAGVITGLNALVTGLSAVTGFLSENEGVARALALIIGASLVPRIAEAVAGFAALRATKVADFFLDSYQALRRLAAFLTADSLIAPLREWSAGVRTASAASTAAVTSSSVAMRASMTGLGPAGVAGGAAAGAGIEAGVAAGSAAAQRRIIALQGSMAQLGSGLVVPTTSMPTVPAVGGDFGAGGATRAQRAIEGARGAAVGFAGSLSGVVAAGAGLALVWSQRNAIHDWVDELVSGKHRVEELKAALVEGPRSTGAGDIAAFTDEVERLGRFDYQSLGTQSRGFVRDLTSAFSIGEQPSKENLGDRLRDLDKAAAEAAASGHPEEIRRNLDALFKANGYPGLNEMLDKMPKLAGALALVDAEAKPTADDVKRVADELKVPEGVAQQFTDLSAAIGLSPKELDAISTEAGLSLDAIKRLSEQGITDMTAFAEGVSRARDAFASGTNPLELVAKFAEPMDFTGLEAQKTAYEDLGKASAKSSDSMAAGWTLTAERIRTAYTNTLTNVQSFQADLRALVERGLNPATLQQLMEMEPQQAATLAKAILSDTGKTTIDVINQVSDAMNQLITQQVRMAQLQQTALQSKPSDQAQFARELPAAQQVATLQAITPTITAEQIQKMTGLDDATLKSVNDHYALAVIGIERVVADTVREHNPLEALKMDISTITPDIVGGSGLPDAAKARITGLATTIATTSQTEGLRAWESFEEEFGGDKARVIIEQLAQELDRRGDFAGAIKLRGIVDVSETGPEITKAATDILSLLGATLKQTKEANLPKLGEALATGNDRMLDSAFDDLTGSVGQRKAIEAIEFLAGQLDAAGDKVGALRLRGLIDDKTFDFDVDDIVDRLDNTFTGAAGRSIGVMGKALKRGSGVAITDAFEEMKRKASSPGEAIEIVENMARNLREHGHIDAAIQLESLIDKERMRARVKTDMRAVIDEMKLRLKPGGREALESLVESVQQQSPAMMARARDEMIAAFGQDKANAITQSMIDKLRAAGNSLGAALLDYHLNPQLIIDDPKITLPGGTQIRPHIGTTRIFALGGFDTTGDVANAHQPEFARSGVTRVWLEPETKGETYLPHAADHRRPAAERYLAQTADLFGGRYLSKQELTARLDRDTVHLAEGGVIARFADFSLANIDTRPELTTRPRAREGEAFRVARFADPSSRPSPRSTEGAASVEGRGEGKASRVERFVDRLRERVVERFALGGIERFAARGSDVTAVDHLRTAQRTPQIAGHAPVGRQEVDSRPSAAVREPQGRSLVEHLVGRPARTVTALEHQRTFGGQRGFEGLPASHAGAWRGDEGSESGHPSTLRAAVHGPWSMDRLRERVERFAEGGVRAAVFRPPELPTTINQRTLEGILTTTDTAAIVGRLMGEAARPEVERLTAPPPPSAAAAGAAGGAAVSGWVLSAMAYAGAPQDWFPTLMHLVSRESGGNPFAVNPITVLGQHATGLFQMLPSTFRSNMLSGYGNILNPIDNGISAIRYIMGRYGSPGRIPHLFDNRYQGYALGGVRRAGLVADDRRPEGRDQVGWVGGQGHVPAQRATDRAERHRSQRLDRDAYVAVGEGHGPERLRIHALGGIARREGRLVRRSQSMPSEVPSASIAFADHPALNEALPHPRRESRTGHRLGGLEVVAQPRGLVVENLKRHREVTAAHGLLRFASGVRIDARVHPRDESFKLGEKRTAEIAQGDGEVFPSTQHRPLGVLGLGHGLLRFAVGGVRRAGHSDDGHGQTFAVLRKADQHLIGEHGDYRPEADAITYHPHRNVAVPGAYLDQDSAAQGMGNLVVPPRAERERLLAGHGVGDGGHDRRVSLFAVGGLRREAGVARRAQPDVSLAWRGIAAPAAIGREIDGPGVGRTRIGQGGWTRERDVPSGIGASPGHGATVDPLRHGPERERMEAAGYARSATFGVDLPAPTAARDAAEPVALQRRWRAAGRPAEDAAALPMEADRRSHDTDVTTRPGFVARITQERRRVVEAVARALRRPRPTEAPEGVGAPLAWIEVDATRPDAAPDVHRGRTPTAPPGRIGPAFVAGLSPVVAERLARHEPPALIAGDVTELHRLSRSVGPLGRGRLPEPPLVTAAGGAVLAMRPRDMLTSRSRRDLDFPVAMPSAAQFRAARGLLGPEAQRIVADARLHPRDTSRGILRERESNLRALSTLRVDRIERFETAHLPSFAGGGTVPGRPGEPKVILAHGGERVVAAPAPAQPVRPLLPVHPAGGRSVTINAPLTIHGPLAAGVTPADVKRAQKEVLEDAMRFVEDVVG